MRHALLVMTAKGRQDVAHSMQRLAHPGHIAVAENRPDATKERQGRAVDLGFLRGEEADDRLRGGETDRAHACSNRAAPPASGGRSLLRGAGRLSAIHAESLGRLRCSASPAPMMPRPMNDKANGNS